MSAFAGKPPVVFLMGPTASGKTDLACALVDRFNFEIVSVDSAMVYRRLDIGSAKPPPSLLARYPHRLIDLCEPSETYSAAQFRCDALTAIEEIHRVGRTPLLVGGTGLYFRILEGGIAAVPESNPQVRAKLADELATHGLPVLHARLAKHDPVSAMRIHRNDPQRTLRALEVFEQTGVPMSDLIRDQRAPELSFEPYKIVFAPGDRDWLHKQIATRFRSMITAGFINEVGALQRCANLSLGHAALKAVGYRAVWRYLDGEYDVEEMIERGIIATRQLAKRQFTWFRADAKALWFDSRAPKVVEQLAVALKRDIKLQST